MRFSLNTGTFFAFVFLGIVVVANAFVYWVPIWKSSTSLKHHGKKGWKPIGHGHGHGHGHSFGWKSKKPFFHHNIHHHHDSHHHHKFPKLKFNFFKPKHFHKGCHLCHGHSWKRPHKSHHHDFHHHSHKHHFKGHHFDIFPKHFHKSHKHHKGHHFDSFPKHHFQHFPDTIHHHKGFGFSFPGFGGGKKGHGWGGWDW